MYAGTRETGYIRKRLSISVLLLMAAMVAPAEGHVLTSYRAQARAEIAAQTRADALGAINWVVNCRRGRKRSNHRWDCPAAYFLPGETCLELIIVEFSSRYSYRTRSRHALFRC